MFKLVMYNEKSNKDNLKQETMRKIRQNKLYITVNWKYKLLITTTILEMYFLSFGVSICK